MYAKIENKTVVEWPILNIRSRLPTISLPVVTENTDNLPVGFVFVKSLPTVSFDSSKEYLRPLPPNFDGTNWTHDWQVVEFSAEEIASIARFMPSLSPEL